MRYNKVFAILLLVIALALLALRIALYFFTGNLPLLDYAIIFFLIYAGYRYLTGIFFELHSDKIVIYLIGGPFKKTIYISSVSNLIFSGTDLFLTYEGKRKKIPVGPFMSNREDWRNFKIYVEQQNPGGELHEG